MSPRAIEPRTGRRRSLLPIAPANRSNRRTPIKRPRVELKRRCRDPVRFGPRARRCLAALADAIAPSGIDELGIEDLEGRVIDYLARFCAYLPRPLPRVFGPALGVFDYLPLVFGPRRRRFVRLDRAERRRFLYRLLSIRGVIGDLTHSIRGLVALAIYEQPEILARMRYDSAAWIRQKVIERRERYGAIEPW